MNTADYLLANGKADDIAIVEGPNHVTYAQLRQACGAIGYHLAQLELPAGSAVSIMGTNSAFWAASYLAAMKLGLVAVPLATTTPPDTIAGNLAWVDCRAALLDRRLQRRIGAALSDELPVITDAALEASEEFWPVTPTDPDTDAALMFTSGTTAGPKAVRLTHRNIQANTDSIVDYLHLRSDDRMLVILPFFYVFGASLLHTHLRAGARVVLMNNFAFPEKALDLIENEACTGIAGVPSSYQFLLRASTVASRPLPSLRRVLQAGGKLHPPQIMELVQALPNAEVVVMYGQTEATARLSYLPPDLVVDKIGSIGRGIPGVDLQVIDDEGRPVAPGEVGEIIARGDNISPGYFREPQATAEKFSGGALHTGDLATVDDEGFIYVVDRKGDFIKSWGYRVSSHDVEAAALELPGLTSAAAIGVPDDDAGEAVVLVVQAAPGATTDAHQILAHCRERLPRHMVPKEVRFIDHMPLNPNGKIDKRAVVSAAPNLGKSRT